MDLSAFTISCVFYLRDSYHFGIIAQHKLLGGMRMNVDLGLHVLFLFQTQFYLIFLLTNDGRWTLVYIREAETSQRRCGLPARAAARQTREETKKTPERPQRHQRDHLHTPAETSKYFGIKNLITKQCFDLLLYKSKIGAYTDCCGSTNKNGQRWTPGQSLLSNFRT